MGEDRHVIQWTYDKFFARVEPKLICQSSADAFCRTKPSHTSGCECEEFFAVQRDDRGWFHVVETTTDDDKKVKYVHRHETADECNIELFMNEDPMDTIMESYIGVQKEIQLTMTEVEPVWGGEGYEWRLADTTA